MSVSVVAVRDRSEPLVSRCVPYLELDVFAGDSDDARPILDSDGVLGLALTGRLVEEMVQDRGLSCARVSDQNQLQLEVHSSGL